MGHWNCFGSVMHAYNGSGGGSFGSTSMDNELNNNWKEDIDPGKIGRNR